MKPEVDPIYTPANTLLFNLLYGENLISLGGKVAIDAMFSDINLNGLSAIDIGFGLGGVAFYLVQTHQLKISGLETNAWMVQHAQHHAPKSSTAVLQFATYDQLGNIPFANQHFDLAYSKGVLNHVIDKLRLFRDIQRVLKPSGIFVIADWIYPEDKYDLSVFPVRETKKSYLTALQTSGFTDITFRDDSMLFMGYVKSFIDNMSRQQKIITEKYGLATYSTILSDHEKLMTDLQQKNKFAVRIVAKKKTNS